MTTILLGSPRSGRTIWPPPGWRHRGRRACDTGVTWDVGAGGYDPAPVADRLTRPLVKPVLIVTGDRWGDWGQEPGQELWRVPFAG